MKIDHTYLKGLLEAFEAAEKPYTTIDELKENGYPYNDHAFTFHMNILHDLGLIDGTATGRNSIGMEQTISGEIIWIRGRNIRLTAAGHEYIDTLNEPDVWTTIQENFSQSALNTIMAVSKDLAVSLAKKKLKL